MDKDLLEAARLAALEGERHRRQRRTLAILAVSLALGMGLVVYVVSEVTRSRQPMKVYIDPAKLPPVPPRPGG